MTPLQSSVSATRDRRGDRSRGRRAVHHRRGRAAGRFCRSPMSTVGDAQRRRLVQPARRVADHRIAPAPSGSGSAAARARHSTCTRSARAPTQASSAAAMPRPPVSALGRVNHSVRVRPAARRARPAVRRTRRSAVVGLERDRMEGDAAGCAARAARRALVRAQHGPAAARRRRWSRPGLPTTCDARRVLAQLAHAPRRPARWSRSAGAPSS